MAKGAGWIGHRIDDDETFPSTLHWFHAVSKEMETVHARLVGMKRSPLSPPQDSIFTDVSYIEPP